MLKPRVRWVGKILAMMCGLALIFVAIAVAVQFGMRSPVMADGMASANVVTWFDEDRDGVRGGTEPPLPWVEIVPGYHEITDQMGQGSSYEFKPGCARDCWEGSYVAVETPHGYVATTPTRYRLTGVDDTYQFGFAPVGTEYVPDLPDSPPWCRAFLNRALPLQQCQIDSSLRELSLALGPTASAEDDIDEVHDVIRSLDMIAPVTFTHIELTIPSAGLRIVCPVATLREWDGRLAGSEIFLDKCGQATPTPAP